MDNILKIHLLESVADHIGTTKGNLRQIIKERNKAKEPLLFGDIKLVKLQGLGYIGVDKNYQVEIMPDRSPNPSGDSMELE
jgi:hypothetical protein